VKVRKSIYRVVLVYRNGHSCRAMELNHELENFAGNVKTIHCTLMCFIYIFRFLTQITTHMDQCFKLAMRQINRLNKKLTMDHS
jgi:hypothetical protein